MARYIKAFAEFYRRAHPFGHDAAPKGSFIAAVGDRSILILDGREGSAKHHRAAVEWCRRHRFDGYRLCRGTITNPFYLTAAVKEVDDTRGITPVEALKSND